MEKEIEMIYQMTFLSTEDRAVEDVHYYTSALQEITGSSGIPLGSQIEFIYGAPQCRNT